MALCQVEAVVIKHRPLGEADKLLTFFSREKGKIRGVARGARRPRNRFLATSQPFSHSELLLYRGKGLYYVSQSQLITSFYRLREDLERMTAASYVSELVDSLVEEGCAQPRLFALLVTALHLLTGASDVRPALRHFEVGLLEELGLGPDLRRCADCGCTLPPGEVAISSRWGGAVCFRCARQDGEAISLQRATVALMGQLRELTPRGLVSLRVQEPLLHELEVALEKLLQHAGAGGLKSRPFLQGWALPSRSEER